MAVMVAAKAAGVAAVAVWTGAGMVEVVAGAGEAWMWETALTGVTPAAFIALGTAAVVAMVRD